MKTSASTASAARNAVVSLGARGKTNRIPDEVRRVVLGYAHEARSAGSTWIEIAEAVGLSSSVLMHWDREGRVKKSKTKTKARLRPVVIRESFPQPSDPVGIVLITGGGERIEGLGIEDTIRIVRGLR